MTNDHAPLVSAIVPVYKAEAFLSATLASLQTQTWPNIEILIGDDASPDRSVDVIREFVSRNPNARAVFRSKNLGWIGNTNDLLAEAAGEYLFFLAHDDTIEPTYVERLVDALIGNPDAVLAYSDYDEVRLGQKPTVRIFDSLNGRTNPVARAKYLLSMRDAWWVPYRGVFRDTAHIPPAGLHTSVRVGQVAADWTWLFQLALIGEFVRVPEVLYHKLFMAESLSATWKAQTDVRRALLLSAVKSTVSSPLGVLDKLSILLLIASNLVFRNLYLVTRYVAKRFIPDKILTLLRYLVERWFGKSEQGG